MGRSAGDVDRAGSAKAAQAWEAVRRALGKWVAHTEVRAVPPSAMMRLAAVSPNDLLDDSEVVSGIRESECRPEARVLGRIAPEALPGGGNADLATVITIISGNSALGDGDCRVHSERIVPTAARVFVTPSDELRYDRVTIAPAPTRPPGGEVRSLALDTLKVPKTGRLHAVLPRFSRAPKVSRMSGGRNGLPRFPRIVVRNGIGAVARIPLIRMSLEVDRSNSAAHPEERTRLAATGNTTPDRMAVVGMFPGIPVGAISRLALKPDGSELRIWLKPEALAAGVAPKMLTLIVGRDRVTGKTIQTVQ